MNYHPIMGITFFFLFLILAFLLGRGFFVSKKKNIAIIRREKKKSDSISPDARWLN